MLRHNQSQSNDNLISSYGKVITFVVICFIVIFVAMSFWGAIRPVTGQTMELEHYRLINVLDVIKSKWLKAGKPNELSLSWQLPQQMTSEFKLSNGGWPLLPTANEAGCETLWHKLLGDSSATMIDHIEYDIFTEQCHYFNNYGDKVTYKLETGKSSFTRH